LKPNEGYCGIGDAMTNAITSQGDTLVLTKKEVEEAREDFERNSKSPALPCLFSYEEERCRVRLKVLGLCRLCKKLTQFVEGEDE